MIPLFVLPESLLKWLGRTFIGIGKKVAFAFPGLSYDLRLIGSAFDEGEYVVASAANAAVWGAILYLLVVALAAGRGMVTAAELSTALGSLDGFFAVFLGTQRVLLVPAVLAFLLMFAFFMRYPRIIAGKMVEDIDKDLIYALKDMMVQISSGISLFNALVSVSNSGYGKISDEFAIVVQDISAGESQDRALEKMTMKTESEFLRRTIWQLITALRAGASLQGALGSVLLTLRQYQSAKIKAYTQEMNLWVLLFIMVAVAVPSLGVTLLVILSTFASLGVNEMFIIFLMLVCFVSEGILVGMIRVRRPVLRV